MRRTVYERYFTVLQAGFYAYRVVNVFQYDFKDKKKKKINDSFVPEYKRFDVFCTSRATYTYLLVFLLRFYRGDEHADSGTSSRDKFPRLNASRTN